MPFLEDIPALIPVSIALALIIVSISWQFTDYLNKTEALSLQRAVQNAAEKLVYKNHGILGQNPPTMSFSSSSPFEFKPPAYTLVEVEDKDYPVIVSLPVVIKNASNEFEIRRLYVAGKRK